MAESFFGEQMIDLVDKMGELYREDYFQRESENHNLAECIVMKNRHGNTGSIELQWLPEYTTYASVDRIHSEE